jgi:hypothetical protein
MHYKNYGKILIREKSTKTSQYNADIQSHGDELKLLNGNKKKKSEDSRSLTTYPGV